MNMIDDFDDWWIYDESDPDINDCPWVEDDE